MNEHEWFIERIAEHLAGGLPDLERTRFEQHRDTCPACARELTEFQQTEQSMTALFTDIVPPRDFEQRLLGRLRFSAASRFSPMIRRAAIAAAAAIVLGGFGFVAQRQIQSGGLAIEHGKIAATLGHWRLSPNRGPAPTTQPAHLSYSFANDHFVRDDSGLNGNYDGGDVGFKTHLLAVPTKDGLVQDKEALRAPAHVSDSVTFYADSDADRSRGENYMGGRVTSAGEYTLGRRALILAKPVQPSAAGQTDWNTVLQNGTNKALPQLSPPRQSARDFFDQPTSTTSNFYFKPTELAAAEPKAVEQQIDEAGKDAKRVQREAGEEVKLAIADTNAPADQTRTGLAANATTPLEGQPEPNAPPTTQITRKVIRNGDIEFEVDSFDSAATTITKIVSEETGYIATTNSEKLPNGKVKGTIVVRVPPDHLDTLVMKLRGLGDLKRQNLTAEDVTKQYTDSASELRAARAMEERLLNIIKTSQGQIKDLLAAEKELATWRGKIEKLEGEIRYYDNLVSLSTLNVSLFERDIKKADVLKETENVDMGVETEDVEASRASAIKAIEDAKGRIVESELKKLDAGQLAAKVVAEIPPDTSGPALDRLKQLGKVARLESHRTQKSANDQPATSDTKLERGETHLVLSLYNLANIAPRQTSNLTLAAPDVEQAYNAILKLAAEAGGRVVTSNLNRQTDQQTSGVVQLEVKSADAENVLSQIRGNGEVNRLTVTENPDTNNVTPAKRGFNVQIVSLASLLPREVNNRSLASADVDKSYQSLLEALRQQQARIILSRTEDAGKGEHNAYIDFEIPRTKLDAIEKALASAGETYSRSVNAAQDAENVTDSKVQFKLSLAPASSLPPRETDSLGIETSDVDSAAQSFQNAAQSAGGRVVDSNFSKDQRGQTARIVVEVPCSAASKIVADTKHLGTVRASQQSTNPQSPSGELARARIDLTLASPDVLVAPEHGVFATLRNGLSTSFAGLMWSLQLIVIGLCLVAPWVIVVWIAVKLLRRMRRKPAVAAS